MKFESLVSDGLSGNTETCKIPNFSDLNTCVGDESLIPRFSEKKLESTNLSNEFDIEDFTNKISADENGHIKTRNESLEGQNHPVTDVPFKEKTVVTDTGEEVTGVFPEFESVFDAQLPENLYKASDSSQFLECNRQLKEAIEENPELAEKFDEEQLDQINNGLTPDGYTWHHNEETGKMQLVDSETHAMTGHTGGRSIWGGGTDNR